MMKRLTVFEYNLRFSVIACLFCMAPTSCAGKSEIAPGGTGGSGGTQGDGGGDASGDGDAPATGGSESVGTGGDNGSGGSGVGLPTLGDACTEPGASACASNNPRLALLCSADGRWEVAATCPGSEICDAREEAATSGSCVAINPLCIGQEDGEAFCDENEVVVCSSGGLEMEREACDSDCLEGQCTFGDACPGEVFTNCAGDCPGAELDECVLGHTSTSPAIEISGLERLVFRLSESSAGPKQTDIDCPQQVFALINQPGTPNPIRVTVGSGWQMVPFEGSWFGALCGKETFSSCMVTDFNVVFIPEEGAPPRNVTVEVVPEGSTCP